MILQAAKQGFRVWWHNLVHLTIFNILWVVGQVLIITGPPATAAIYVIADKVAQGELVGAPEVWAIFRAMFLPAWKWAICNLAVLLMLGSYLLWAQTQTGVFSAFVSVLVLIVLAFWLAMNVVYWPLWLAQSDASLRNTLRNAFVVVLSNPAICLLLLIFNLVLVFISALIVVPLIHFLMIWLALLGINLTQALIKRIPAVSEPIS